MPAPSYGPEPRRAPAFILALAALGRLHFSAAFALCPLRIARGRRWCEHDYPRWGAHNASDAIVKLLRARTAAFYHGSELPRPPPTVRGSDSSLYTTPMLSPPPLRPLR